MSKKKAYGPCAYCGQPGTTQDHVPPRGMFAKGTPEPPWVPSCEACNQGASQNDQFMQRLAMVRNAEHSRDGIEVGEKIVRSWEYEELKEVQPKSFSELVGCQPRNARRPDTKVHDRRRSTRHGDGEGGQGLVLAANQAASPSWIQGDHLPGRGEVGKPSTPRERETDPQLPARSLWAWGVLDPVEI